jgi:hypothetical protein
MPRRRFPNPVCRVGDLWICGKHRVPRGDALRAEDVSHPVSHSLRLPISAATVSFGSPHRTATGSEPSLLEGNPVRKREVGNEITSQPDRYLI